METELKKTSPNTTNSSPETKLEPVACSGGCGKELQPVFYKDFYGKEISYVPTICDGCHQKAEDEERARQTRAEYWNDSGLKKRHEDMKLSTFMPKNASQKKALEVCRSWQADKNIYFHGHVGTGKTHLAVSLLKKAIVDLCIQTEVITGVNLLYEIKATFSDRSNENSDEIIARYSNIPLLIIDDLGAERSTDWVREVFYLIIDNRYSAMLPTIVTSNFSPKDLADKLDDRMISRLLDGAIILNLEGPDHRLGRINKPKEVTNG
jgi:DNA replication protein DnaC